ncbi:carboxypeptidase-like regulatory domain-containing protein [Limibacter armeniacum]|uniref:TonB-dependent receptor n=1 Tax=Limibacter armeniacum TaxID=466084 RepID=UPI002FE536D6
MTRVFILTISAIVFTFSAFAQKGTIKGQVKDAESGEEIIGANVMLEGTTTGANTNVFGQFEFKANPGTYNVVGSYIGYKKFVQQVTVTAGQVVSVDMNLALDATELVEVEVVGKANKESAEALMVERKNANVMIQSIGAEEMSVKGVSNVEDAATKISGVSKVSGKGVFVRGLGDRYNNALLNGLPVPSTDPDLKVIPLSIFPSDVVKNIDMAKTFSSRMYGDFAGATVDITTKDFPEEGAFTIGIGGSYNSQTTGKSFKSFKDGDMEFFGMTGKGRVMPSQIESVNVFEAKGENASNLFTSNYAHQVANAPIANSFKLTGGNLYDLAGESQFGFMVSAAYDNNYTYRNGVTRNLNAQAAPLISYNFDTYEYTTSTSGLANFYYRINSDHKVNLNVLYVNESSNELSEYAGFSNDLGTEVDLSTRRGTYRQNMLLVNQLLGEHNIKDERIQLNWGISYSIAKGQEPDRKQLSVTGPRDEATLFTLNAPNNHRFFSFLNENEYAAKVEGKIGFGEQGAEGFASSLILGYQGRLKSRDFNWRQLNIVEADNSTMSTFDFDNPGSFIEDQLQAGNIYYKDQNDPSREFEASLNVHAGYAAYDFDLVPEKLKVVAGVRTELANQTVKYKKLSDLYSSPLRVSTYDTLSILPSLNLKYALDEESNLRFAVSKTVTRPNFKEVIPFQYQEMYGGALIQGNANLQNSDNYNADLKYEIFPNHGELFSMGVFGKYIESPIEKVQIPESGTLFTFQNGDKAQIYGVEMELSKRLNNVFNNGSEFLSRFVAGLNASYMYTQIIIDNPNSILTNKERALQGASPYIINADLTYEAEFGASVVSTFTVTYNVFGDRIYSAGAQGAGDIYERSYSTLDFIWKNRIAEKLSVDFKVSNILNPEVIREQEEFANGADTKLVNSYSMGTNASFSLNYTF